MPLCSSIYGQRSTKAAFFTSFQRPIHVTFQRHALRHFSATSTEGHAKAVFIHLFSEASRLRSLQLVHMHCTPNFIALKNIYFMTYVVLLSLTSVSSLFMTRTSQAEHPIDDSHEKCTFQHDLEFIVPCYTCIIHSRPR